MKLRIPATSANIGPGFDVAGLALGLYQYLEVKLADKINLGPDHLVYVAYERAFAYRGQDPKPASFNYYGDIPRSRGLGSSAACIVAGLVAANELGDLNLSQDQLLSLATEIEGHPDNVAPALLGGLVYSMVDKVVYSKKVPVHSSLLFTLCIPETEFSTEKARGLLPKKLEMKDAVCNLSHLPFLIQALEEGDFDLLKLASKDCLHEPYRGPYIPYFLDLKKALEKKACVHISGAGSTSLLISKVPLKEELEDLTKGEAKILQVTIDQEGVKKIDH